MRQKVLGFLCVICCAVGSLGCSTTPTATQESVARLATQYAVIKYAEKFAPDVRAEKLTAARRIVEEVRNFATGEAVSIPSLSMRVKLEIAKSTSSPADQFLAGALVDAISTELQARLGKGILSGDQLLRVADVLQWVIDATALAGV